LKNRIMSRVVFDAAAEFGSKISVLIIGAGAAGLVAALAAMEAGAEVAVLERDPLPRGSTSLSAGLIPAAGTRWQRERGIDDSPALLEADIERKSEGMADPGIANLVATVSGPAVEWLADTYALPFSLVHDFNYPGHTARRMHGLPSRTGLELIDRLRAAVELREIPILTSHYVKTLFARHSGEIIGVAATRPDGTEEKIGCGALVLACNGYGASPALLARHIPEIAGALYFGHPGNQGDAVVWGSELGAALADMSGHQGHGSVAHPHNILITWATMMEGGFQVNADGRRFSDEAHGYSEQAAAVLAQPTSNAFSVFDDRIAGIARQFEDFQNAEATGAVLTATSPQGLADAMKVPAGSFLETFKEVEKLKRAGGRDRYGRDWSNVAPLSPPLHAVRVTGALFHTQGGLEIDMNARVKRPDGKVFPNLYAAGGAERGVSGPKASGYLSGNGLLTAISLGRVAGRHAAIISDGGRATI
jgi:fumarate reductase flavoprotein subunit